MFANLLNLMNRHVFKNTVIKRLTKRFEVTSYLVRISSRANFKSICRIACVAFIFVLNLPTLAIADRLTVGVAGNAPFAFQAEDKPSGIAIEAMQKIANRRHFTLEYTYYNSVQHLIDAAAESKIDIGVGAISVTADRAARVDFSFPWSEGGITLVHREEQFSLLRTIEEIFSQYNPAIFLASAGCILLFSYLLMVWDRRFDPTYARDWKPGLARSFWNVMSYTFRGRAAKRENAIGSFGEILAGVWIFVGAGIVSILSALVTSTSVNLMVEGQFSDVDDFGDIDDRVIGYVEGSGYEETLGLEGLRLKSFATEAEAMEGLRQHDVEAVIYDEAVIRHYIRSNEVSDLEVLAEPLLQEKYAFIFPPMSPLKREIDKDIISLIEEGVILDVQRKYLGR